MTYKEAQVYIEYIKVLLDKEGLSDKDTTDALNAASQALNYELLAVSLPTNLPTKFFEGKKIAVYR